jgi:hypothetical protein
MAIDIIRTIFRQQDIYGALLGDYVGLSKMVIIITFILLVSKLRYPISRAHLKEGLEMPFLNLPFDRRSPVTSYFLAFPPFRASTN